MSLEGPTRSRHELIPDGASESFSDLQEKTGNVIQVYRSSNGERIGVQVLTHNPDRGASVTPLSPEIAEKTFREADEMKAMDFYREMIEALKGEAESETDREKIFAFLKSKIEAS